MSSVSYIIEGLKKKKKLKEDGIFGTEIGLPIDRESESTDISGVATRTGKLNNDKEEYDNMISDGELNNGSKAPEIRCPECGSKNINVHSEVFHCVDCGKEWSVEDSNSNEVHDDKESKETFEKERESYDKEDIADEKRKLKLEKQKLNAEKKKLENEKKELEIEKEVKQEEKKVKESKKRKVVEAYLNEGSYIEDRDGNKLDSITLHSREWCWFYGVNGTKYTVHCVRGKMKAFKDGTLQEVKPTKEMKQKIQVLEGVLVSESYDVFKNDFKKIKDTEVLDSDVFTDGWGNLYKAPKAGYSKIIKFKGSQFRYNYKTCELEVLDNKGKPIDGISLGVSNWADNPDYWVEMYFREIEDGLEKEI